jgi:hypothetical protein
MLHSRVGIIHTDDLSPIIYAEDELSAIGVGQGHQCGGNIVAVNRLLFELGVQIFPSGYALL